MRPSPYLIRLIGILAIAALLIFIARLFAQDSIAFSDDLSSGSWADFLQTVWLSGAVILIIATLWDAIACNNPIALRIRRQLPHSLALGVFARVNLTLENPSRRTLRIWLTDELPAQITSSNLPLQAEIQAESKKQIEYPVLPIERGEARFGKTRLRIESPFRLWLKNAVLGDAEAIKVYPNFAPIAQSASVSLEHHIAQLGIHLQQRRGEGSDFHQLREYREGDSLRQIDWNATSRRHKPVSREYQDERDQEVIFLLDCGRRLRSKEQDISLFDHALNAFLLTSYVALRQGDGVGFLSFGGTNRWMSPVKHPSNINTLLNQLYDLHSTTQASDYMDVAQELLLRRKKRALVVILTCAREEDVDELDAAVKLLASRHMVMLASIRDSYFDEQLEVPVTSFNDALEYCATQDYQQRRKQVLAQLKNRGAVITDSLPATLHLSLVQEYLRLKRSGRF